MEKVCLQSQKVCDECNWFFARLDEATNGEARKQFFSKDKSIVMTSKLPNDVKRGWKLLLFCGFSFWRSQHICWKILSWILHVVFLGFCLLFMFQLTTPSENILNFMSSWPGCGLCCNFVNFLG